MYVTTPTYFITARGGDFSVGNTDAFTRRQIWYKDGANSLLRLGANSADGDGSDVASDGIVIWNKVSGDYGARIKANRFGLTRAGDSTDYYFLVNDSNLFFKHSSDYLLYVDSATKRVGILAGATPSISLSVGERAGIYYASDGRACNVVKMTNKSGLTLSSGTIVDTYGSFDMSFTTADIGSIAPIGIMQDDSCANASLCWVGVSGVCAVMMDPTESCLRGQWIGTSQNVGGTARCATMTSGLNFVEPEVGHALTATTNPGGTILGAIHFN